MAARLLFSLALVLSVLYACYGQALNCPYEPLPTSLNSIAYLGFNGETHLQGEYYTNFSLYSQFLPFSVAAQSAFRVYVAPHDDVDVDVWLMNAATGAPVARSSLAIGTEEVIQTQLPPGSYVLRLSYFGFWTGGYDVNDCDTVKMELAVVPVSVLAVRTVTLPCTGELLPSPTIVVQDHYDYNSDADGRFYNVLSQYSGGSPRWVTAYNFTTNSTGGVAYWSLEAFIGFDFVSGGSLGLLLIQNRNGSTAPNLNCVASGQCSGAVGGPMNQKVLRAVLLPNTDYSLWLYDLTAEKDSSLSPCTGFNLRLHLDLVNMPQSFTTCTAPSVPTALIPGQFDDPAGFVHYYDTPVVQLSQSRVPITINITTASFFKVYVSSPRLDIDIRLQNSAGQSIGYSYKFGPEETMAKYLTPDSYVMTLIYFGNYAPVFCETFVLEVAIAPVNAYQNLSFCAVATNGSVATVLPDLSALATSNGNYSLPRGPLYQVNYNGDWSTRPLLVQNFTVTQTSMFKATLNDNFLLGDLEAYLISYNASNQRTTSVNRRNQNYLYTTINPGSYGFVIATGPAGTPTALINPFPSCAVFTLHVHLVPASVAGVCSQYDRVPPTLNDPRYLAPSGSGVVHFQDNFLIPLVPGQFSVSESISFTVAQPSLFRVWTEAHHIDIDMYLYRVDPVTGRQTLVASVIKLNTEEEIIQTLSSAVNYRLTMIYYHWTTPPGHPDPPCSTYNMELAIRPLNATIAPAMCSGQQPNVANLVPAFAPGQSFYTDASFYYTQGTNAYRLAIPVAITGDMAAFRAVVRYSFPWGDLSVSLLKPDGSVGIVGEDSYNKNDLDVQLLGPGNYTLLIYEPVPIPNAVSVLRGCRQFVVSIGYGPTAASIQQPLGCPTYPPPKTLNSLPYLSTYSGNRVHFSRPLLPNVLAAMDYVDFNVTTTSVFSVYIPATTSLDVDMLLRNGSSTNPGPRIDLQNGYYEEAITQILSPGTYNLQFRYYGMNGARLPDRSECVSFLADFALSPVSYLQIPRVTQPCQDSPNSFTLALGSANGTYSRNQGTSLAYQRTAPLVLTTQALLVLDVRYEFQTGGLAVDLVGTARPANANPTPVNVVASSGMNHAYLTQVLPPGSYNVTVRNPFVSQYLPPGPFANFVCSSYEVAYTLTAYSAQDQQCTTLDRLPTDLYSAAGGSAPYGGPQSALDGSVRIFGDNFFIDPAASRHHYILFNITVPSFMRMFAQGGRTDDIDFMIYSTVGNNSVSGLVYYSGGVEEVESALVRLNPQPGPYALDLYAYRIAADVSCPVATLEVAIKSVQTVQNELLCPVVMPSPAVPPAYVPIFGAQQEAYIFNEFVFTQQFIQQNMFGPGGGGFRYRMTLDVRVNTTLLASIGFDFLAANFRLALLDSNQNTLVNGLPWSTEEEDDYYNFYNLLMADVAPGTYFLEIRERLGTNYNVTNYCHRFEFFLSSTSVQAPTVTNVFPAGRVGLNPFETLWITVSFSEPVYFNYTTNDQLLSIITSRQGLYLSPASSIGNLYPSSTTFNRAMRTITASFTGLLFNQSYALVINSTVFVNAGGQSFLPDNQTHVYSTVNCLCSGQGVCSFNSTGYLCLCNPGYAGRDCQNCAAGYHPAGSVCVPNLVCTNSTCGPFGSCYQTASGSIGCSCLPGYATAGDAYCSVCAPGWTGYPNCTSTGDDQRSTTCLAPILPDNFDTIDYLGFNQRFHLQGEYFIDVNNFKHDITFNLTATSVFRLYIEPHFIDLDFWLYPLNPDGSLGPYIDNGIAIYREEASLQLLQGVAAGTQYLLRLRYFIWDRSKVTYCDTFNFEVEIIPQTQYITQANTVLSLCTPTNSMPPLSSNGTFVQMPPTPFHYHPTQLFTVRATNTMSKTPNFVYAYNFTITTPKRQAALLHAQVDYRFVVGDLSLLLESGNQADHCGQLAGAGTRCTVGDNHRNFNVIHQILQSGNYTLWIYEPIPQRATLSNCTAFQYQFMVTYVDLTEDIFVCNANPIPETLNVPGFLDSSGHVHVSGDFLVDDTQVTFTVNQTSAMRVATNSEGAALILAVYNASGTEVASSFFGLNPTLFTTLSPGNYTLEFVGYAFSDSQCPVVHLELAIAPLAPVPNRCPASAAPVLPSLANYTIPFEFGHTGDGQFPAVYYSFYATNTPWQYNFVVSQPMVVEAILHHDFLTSDLTLVLTNRASPGAPIRGLPRYNQNYLRQTVVNGSYSLSIMTRTGLRPQGFPPCAEFNFELSFVPSAQDLAYPCAHRAEALPTTFNTVRYLGQDTTGFIYQTPNMRVPDFVGYLARSIYFTVTVPSMFRVYTEPHDVDIDLALYINGSATALTDAGYTFNQEEELVYVVQPNATYRLSMLFWKWSSRSIPQCPTFNFEASITPLRALTPLCPNSADHWPPAPPPTISSVYDYNSADTGENLYFQQSTFGSKRMSYTFTLSATYNLYAEVNYDFPTGDLNVNLTGGSPAVTYYGTNTLNGNALNLLQLAAGSYTLMIYEPKQNDPSVLGCSSFSFQLLITPDTSSTLGMDPEQVPPTLDSIAYLYTQNVGTHFQDYYTMFMNSDSETVPFTLSGSTQYVMRVSTDHYVNGLRSLPIRLVLAADNSTVNASPNGETMLAMITPSSTTTYALRFDRPRQADGSISTGPVPVNLQVHVAPLFQVVNDLSPWHLGCPAGTAGTLIDPINVVNNYYSYSTTLQIPFSTLQSQRVLQSLPFTLTDNAVIYTRIGFQFLTGAIEMVLTGTGLDGTNITVNGRDGYNYDEINQVLPAGSYVLSLTQNTNPLWGGQFPQQCAVSVFRITVFPLSAESHVDCTSYKRLPGNLNSLSGGSAPYGGPVDSTGAVHIFGTQFLMPPPISGTAQSVMGFNISSPTLISVITKEQYVAGDIRYTLRTTSSMQLIVQPLTVSTGSYQQSALWLINPAAGNSMFNYELMLTYRQPPSTACPYFALQLAMRPASDVGLYATCNPQANQLIPNIAVATDANGMYNEYFESYWPSSFVNSPQTNGSFTYSINITITRNSQLQVAMGYSSLMNAFQLQLLRVLPRYSYEVARGTWQQQQIGTTDIDVSQFITYSLLSAGQYTMIISQPSIALPFGGANDPRCFPYSWDLHIAPTNTPTLAVTPASGENLSPYSPVSLYLTFSQPVYAAGQALNSSYSAALTQALSLTAVGSTQLPTLTPTLVQPDGRSGQYWRVTFPAPGAAASKAQYAVTLQAGALTNSAGTAVTALASYHFDFADVTCSGHGTYADNFCYCNLGYAGLACELCDNGFNNTAGTIPATCQRSNSGPCFIDSCGCLPNISPCVPLGTCNSSTGVIVCQCKTRYTGPRCDQCAPGYVNYPTCEQLPCNPPCVHGTCNAATSTCTCDPGWTGSTCSTANPQPVPAGDDGDKTVNGLKIFGIVMGVVVVLATVGVVAFRFWRRRRPKYVPMLDAMDLDLEDE